MPAFRLDRDISLYFVRPFCRGGGVARSRPLPILMYHSISDDAEAGIGHYYRVATSPARFAEQMQWLDDIGWQGVSLEAGLNSLGEAEPVRPLVAITFDDGFRDFHTTAWPTLQGHKFSATMYLPTAYIADQRKSFLGRECLTWAEVRELRSQGIRFGSHTVNHPKLYALGWPEIESELHESKTHIEQELGEEVRSFAYPFAYPQEDRAYARTLTALLRDHGYGSCSTTMIGRVNVGENRLELKRLPVNSCDDRALFLAKLAGAYDWLGQPQKWHRTLRRLWREATGAAGKQPISRAAILPSKISNQDT